MRFVRSEDIVRGIGRPESQLFAEDVDKTEYDGRIKTFVCKYFRDDKHDYFLPMWHGAQFKCSRSEFLCMLYVVLIEEGVIVDAQNVRPFLNHLSIVLGDSKYLVDRTGMSRIVSVFKLVTPYLNNTLPEGLSNATRQQIKEYAPFYTHFKERWDNQPPSQNATPMP